MRARAFLVYKEKSDFLGVEIPLYRQGLPAVCALIVGGRTGAREKEDKMNRTLTHLSTLCSFQLSPVLF